MAIQVIAAVQLAGTAISRAKQAKDGMDAISSLAGSGKDADPSQDVDHGSVFDALNLDDATSLSPGHNASELSFFQSVLSETFGPGEDEAAPTGPTPDSPGMGM